MTAKTLEISSCIPGSRRESKDDAPTSAEVRVDLEMPAQTLEISSSIPGSRRDSKNAEPTSAEVGVDLEMLGKHLEIFLQHLWMLA